MRGFISIIISIMLCLMVGCASTTSRSRKPSAPSIATPTTRMEQAIAAYQSIVKKGGWPRVPEGSVFRKGYQGPAILTLRKRLAITDDLRKAGKNDVFDVELEEAIKHFQERHGLTPDGVVGKETLAAINVTAEKRLRQLESNLQLHHQNPSITGEHYVIINIPDYRLKVIENDKPVLSMKVVVGQAEKWQTPLLSSRIKYLILNPKWNVPPSIFEKELIYQLRKDPDYLEKNNMKVVATGENAGELLDPEMIDWNSVDPKDPKMRLVQGEGNGNSLGRIKFIFPNKYAIYLHDTPDKKFFYREKRALSHGCVRVEKPITLATYLMKNDPSWSQDKIKEAIDEGTNRDVRLPSPIDLYIIYRTAWVDSDDVVNFRNDIYNRENSF